MNDFVFPFPDLTLAHKELTYDFCFEKIKACDKIRIVEMAWEKGFCAAQDIWKQYNGEKDFFIIASQSGLKCIHLDKDRIIGGQRYFSEYISGQQTMYLYKKSIALWAEQNNLTQEQAENLILSHEYFHFLECTCLGLTSKLYQVPMIQLGKIKIGKTGIKALSEIGAHGFSRAYFEKIKSVEDMSL